MLSVITKGVKEVQRQIENDKKQMRFASALALTRTAKHVAEVEKRMAKKKLDEPTPFTLRGFRFGKATKRNLQSRVYIMPIQSQYLAWQIEGGRRPKRSRVGEALPVSVRLNKYGNIVGRGKGKIQKLIARPDTFVGTVRGVYGLWQRGHVSKRGKFSIAGKSRATNIKLLIRFVQSVQYEKKLPFYEVAERSFYRRFDREFDKAFAYAMRTAR